MSITINTGPLPEDRATAARKLLLRMHEEYPWIEGYALTGSYGTEKTVFPNADVDINFLGQAGEGDNALPASQELRVDGVDFHFSNRWYGQRIAVDELGLSQLAVVLRWHVLWEREDAISIGRQAARRVFLDPCERAGRLNRELERCVRTTANWQAKTDWSDRNGFFWSRVFCFLCLLAPVDLRAASLARKGLREILDVLRLLDIPDAELPARRSFGVNDFDAASARHWLDRAQKRLAQLETADEHHKRHDHVYYFSGARELVDREDYAAAAFPLWRFFQVCDADEELDAFAEFTHQRDPAALADCARDCRQLAECLQRHQPRLLAHMSRRVEEILP